MATQPNTQGLYQHSTQTTPGDDTVHVVEVDKVQVNLFFDGTLNNYFNVTTTDVTVRGKHGGDDTSYENGLSNVARMWETLDTDRESPDLGVYVEGMGTTRDQGDSTKGYAFGTGETGITSRAQAAFQKVIDKVNEKSPSGPPAMLELNLFGFSRGAATARHFASLLRNREEIAKHFTQRWSRVVVLVNFVGLFDTVSSEGVAYGNDVEDLGLLFVNDAAKRVFHLVALDEYRANFSLTTIASACAAKSTDPSTGARVPMGFELGIPGAHSDVGGGYRAGTAKTEPPEVRHLPPTKAGDDRSALIRGPQDFVYTQGWYGPQDRQATTWKPYRHQRQVQGDYYKVGLSIMVDVAERFTTTVYPPELKADMQARVPEVAQVQTTLRAYAKEKAFAANGGTQANWSLNDKLGTEKAKAFRHAYLHLSLSDSFGMHPRYKNDTEMERQYVAG